MKKMLMVLGAAGIMLFANVVNAEMKGMKEMQGMQTGKGDMGQMMGQDSVSTSDGVKAVFKFTPSRSMVDIALSDAKTGKAITKAKVNAAIANPDGTKQTKELIGDKMDGIFSFMNTLDVSKKGVYKVDADVEVSGKKVKFQFRFEVK